jgi:GTP-binding protein
VAESGGRRVATSELNRFVEEVLARNPVPYYGGGNGRIYYVTQVGTSPPTFNVFVNRRAFFSRSYLRFLNNKLRERYGFEGAVIRIKLSEKERRKDK